MGGCVQSKNESNISNMGRMAVGSTTANISDAVLDAAIGSNPMAALKQRISLTFEGENLPNLDVGSKTDAFIVLYSMVNGRKIKLGETEVIPDSLNPKWIKSIDVDYYFEMQQVFLLEIYDADDPSKLFDLSRHDFVGSFQFNLSRVVSSANQELKEKIDNQKSRKGGSIKIFAEEKKDNYGSTLANFQFDVSCSSSGPLFVTLNKFRGPGKFQPVLKTECKEKIRSHYEFNMVTIDTDTLCGGDSNDAIMAQVFQYNSSGSHKKVSNIEFTLGQLQESSPATVAGSSGATMTFKKFSLQPRVSFLDYVFGGCEIGVQIAIDYTMSNGHPSDPNSLHYVNPRTFQNEYTQAISAVLNVLSDYDADQMYPVYGFGGKLPQDIVSHCFALSGNIYKPECNQVKGVLDAYYKSLNKVALYGPTNFHVFLDMINKYSRYQAEEMSQQNQKYTICLILTDGVITDMEDTIEKIVDGSSLPLSIIIVGIGSADFSMMEALDGDVTPLYSKKLKSYRDRDIVQFVPFRELQRDPVRLAREVLAEVPKQMTSYFIQKGIKPNPRLLQDRQQIVIRNKMKNEMAQMMHVPEGFFQAMQHQLVNECAGLNIDAGQAQQFIGTHGLPSHNHEWLMLNMGNPQYVNQMRM